MRLAGQLAGAADASETWRPLCSPWSARGVTASGGDTIIRTLIIDHESLSRERLRGLLADEPEIEIVGECDDGSQAVVAIERLNPDLMFLDVEIRGLDGFQVLEHVGLDRMPAVVFATAEARYAARAFEVQAVDYILKPLGRERLRKALCHVREKLARKHQNQLAEPATPLLQALQPKERKYLKRIVVRDGGRFLFLPVVDLDWVEASGNYVRFHVGTKSHVLRETMNALEARLDPERFLRIHRSTIVNADLIEEIRPRPYGDYVVILNDGQLLTMSAGYREKLDELRSETIAS